VIPFFCYDLDLATVLATLDKTMHRGGFLRHKIGSRIEERLTRRRRANSDDQEDGRDSLASPNNGANVSSSFTGDAARYSGLLRQTSEHDFLVVEEKPRSRSMGFSSAPGNREAAEDSDGDDDDDVAEVHSGLDQRAQNRRGSEEPISDLDLERLDVLVDDEEEVRPKSTSSASLPKEKETKQMDKIWEVKDTGVFEQQLELLQDQLTSALIENQSLKSEFKGELECRGIPGVLLMSPFLLSCSKLDRYKKCV